MALENRTLEDRKRCCVACRSLYPRQELLRITYSRESDCFSIDQAPALQGRSVYVCRTAGCLEASLKGKKFQKALKRALPDDIVGYLHQVLGGLTTQ